MEALRESLARDFPEFDFVFPSPTSSTLDIPPTGISKMSGLAVLMEHLGIGLDEVCVFGDSENDLPIIEGGSQLRRHLERLSRGRGCRTLAYWAGGRGLRSKCAS
ncbi:HAD family hydrolase [Olsenella sp. Marseille-P4559]|uniref:HAD family hydrolase n=1 Tax=Olsenella sp. Marseille-P4559 TaxID=2364795 RepID=UPI0010309B49|nr:HAD hydrolase family protein [Olsenella sp. Marseille-P4559]